MAIGRVPRMETTDDGRLFRRRVLSCQRKDQRDHDCGDERTDEDDALPAAAQDDLAAACLLGRIGRRLWRAFADRHADHLIRTTLAAIERFRRNRNAVMRAPLAGGALCSMLAYCRAPAAVLRPIGAKHTGF